MVTFFPASSVVYSVLAGAASESSRRPKALAHQRGGNTKAFQNNILWRVSLRKGGEPRLVVRVAINDGAEESDMT
jgi:hypothetical protein